MKPMGMSCHSWAGVERVSESPKAFAEAVGVGTGLAGQDVINCIGPYSGPPVCPSDQVVCPPAAPMPGCGCTGWGLVSATVPKQCMAACSKYEKTSFSCKQRNGETRGCRLCYCSQGPVTQSEFPFISFSRLSLPLG